MKALRFLLVAVLLGFVSAPAFAASSKLSTFAGSYTGNLLLTTSDGTFTGVTKGLFKASTKKDIGTLTLISTVALSQGSTTITQVFNFNNSSLTSTYTESTTGYSKISGSGTGTAGIRKNKITFRGSMDILDIPRAISGTMHLKNRALQIKQSLDSTYGDNAVNYSLKKKAK